MVGYDFDKTIYKYDCSTKFFLYMIFSRFYLLVFSPYFLIVFLLYGIKIIGKKKFKELMYFFIPWYKNIDRIVKKFWDKQIKNIFPYYLAQKQDVDIIISAGLDFIVKEAMNRLGIKNYMATKFDTKTAKITGKNCYGEEKVNRFREKYPNETLDAFYSDSMSDAPMMQISKKAYLVKNTKPSEIDL